MASNFEPVEDFDALKKIIPKTVEKLTVDDEKREDSLLEATLLKLWYPDHWVLVLTLRGLIDSIPVLKNADKQAHEIEKMLFFLVKMYAEVHKYDANVSIDDFAAKVDANFDKYEQLLHNATGKQVLKLFGKLKQLSLTIYTNTRQELIKSKGYQMPKADRLNEKDKNVLQNKLNIFDKYLESLARLPLPVATSIYEDFKEWDWPTITMAIRGVPSTINMQTKFEECHTFYVLQKLGLDDTDEVNKEIILRLTVNNGYSWRSQYKLLENYKAQSESIKAFLKCCDAFGVPPDGMETRIKNITSEGTLIEHAGVYAVTRDAMIKNAIETITETNRLMLQNHPIELNPIFQSLIEFDPNLNTFINGMNCANEDHQAYLKQQVINTIYNFHLENSRIVTETFEIPEEVQIVFSAYLMCFATAPKQIKYSIHFVSNNAEASRAKYENFFTEHFGVRSHALFRINGGRDSHYGKQFKFAEDIDFRTRRIPHGRCILLLSPTFFEQQTIQPNPPFLMRYIGRYPWWSGTLKTMSNVTVANIIHDAEMNLAENRMELDPVFASNGTFDSELEKLIVAYEGGGHTVAVLVENTDEQIRLAGKFQNRQHLFFFDNVADVGNSHIIVTFPMKRDQLRGKLVLSYRYCINIDSLQEESKQSMQNFKDSFHYHKALVEATSMLRMQLEVLLNLEFNEPLEDHHLFSSSNDDTVLQRTQHFYGLLAKHHGFFVKHLIPRPSTFSTAAMQKLLIKTLKGRNLKEKGERREGIVLADQMELIKNFHDVDMSNVKLFSARDQGIAYLHCNHLDVVISNKDNQMKRARVFKNAILELYLGSGLPEHMAKVVAIESVHNVDLTDGNLENILTSYKRNDVQLDLDRPYSPLFLQLFGKNRSGDPKDELMLAYKRLLYWINKSGTEKMKLVVRVMDGPTAFYYRICAHKQNCDMFFQNMLKDYIKDDAIRVSVGKCCCCLSENVVNSPIFCNECLSKKRTTKFEKLLAKPPHLILKAQILRGHQVLLKYKTDANGNDKEVKTSFAIRIFNPKSTQENGATFDSGFYREMSANTYDDLFDTSYNCSHSVIASIFFENQSA